MLFDLFALMDIFDIFQYYISTILYIYIYIYWICMFIRGLQIIFLGSDVPCAKNDLLSLGNREKL